MIEKIYTLLILILFGLSSCTYDEIPNNIDSDFANGENYMQIHLNLPDLNPYEMGRSSTRAMDVDAEREIDLDKFSVLAFKKDKNGNEVFAYKAVVNGNISFDDSNNPNIAIITVKIQRSKSDDESDKYRFVLVANHTVGEVADSDKDYFLETLVFNAPDPCKAEDQKHDPLPMWGQTDYVTVKQGMTPPSVKMYRSLARIDVGLDFNLNGENLSEDANGLGYFKISEVNVYRTYKEGYVAPLGSSMIDYKVPNIPSSAERHKDENPLEYVVSDTKGANQYVREIYIPESNLEDEVTNDNLHCIVVGGYYNGSDQITYYRLDFATEDKDSKKRTYMPILRNHRYIFNITDVRGPGFSTPEDALNSTSNILDYGVITWDESLSNVEVSGKYFFGIDQNDLEFEADGVGDKSFKFKTNLPSAENIELEWKDSPSEYFEASVDVDNRLVKVKGNGKANETNETIIETLFVKAGSFKMPVAVKQKYVNFKYMLDCSSVEVHGTYIYGRELTADNNITLTITAEDNSIKGKKYILETDTINGIYFRGDGVFGENASNAEIPVTLQGFGTLGASESGNSEPLEFKIKSNSSSGSYCEATVIAVGGKVSIVSLADKNNAFGYDPARVTGGTHKVLTATNNFGTNDNSIIKVQGFEFTSTIDYGLSNEESDAYKLITGTGDDGKLADIVYLCYPISFTELQAKSLAKKLINYMDKGGVVIAYLDRNNGAYQLGVELTKLLLNNKYDIEAVNDLNGAGSAGSIYPFPANDVYLTKTDIDARIKEKHELLAKYEGDPILNGPFGDVRDKQWGEDISVTTTLSKMPTEDQEPNLTIYSYNANITKEGIIVNEHKYVTAYKYESKNKNIIFFGDGGFTSSEGGNLNNIDYYRCPFFWDTDTFFPIPKPNYGSSKKMEVYNSTLFCNTMAWAVDRSLALKSKRDGHAKNKSNE